VQAVSIGIEEEWLVEGIIDHIKVDARSVLTKGGIDPTLGAPIFLSTHHKKTPYRVKWAGFDVESSTWVAESEVKGLKALDIYWEQKMAIQVHMRSLKRSQNKLEPEYDVEYGVGVKYWPWVEKGGPVRDPNNPDCPGWETPYQCFF
jgi:hypothetical protein